VAIPDSADNAAAPDPVLRESLTRSAAVELTGVLQVIGDPGGTIYLSGGGVVGVKTPGAPSLEVLVLRSERVPEDGWDAAFSASAAGTSMSAELTTRGLIGAGELEALLRTAVADALFALAYGYVDQCRPEPGAVSVLLPLDPPATADSLLAEAERRMAVLAAIPDLDGYRRARVEPVPGAVAPGTVLGGGRDELLALANGRRTPRDLAFALGRGVYATTLQLTRMQQEGLLMTTSLRAGPPLPAGSPRPTPPWARAEPPASAPVADNSDGTDRTNSDRGDSDHDDHTPDHGGLPRRRRGRHGEADAGPDMSVLLRLLRPRSSGD
jgi:hypothetical protein